MGFEVKSAIAISVLQMVFSSLFGSFVNYKSKMLNISDGVMVGLGGFFGAQFSGYIVKALPSWVLLGFFVLALSGSIYKFFKTNPTPSQEPIESKLILFIVGLFVGMVAISIGIGGALFLTPITVGFLHYDIKRAVSISLMFVVFSSISGLISFSMNNLLDYSSGVILGVGSLVGVY